MTLGPHDFVFFLVFVHSLVDFSYSHANAHDPIPSQNTPYLTSAKRTDFVSEVGNYDDYAIQVKVGLDNAFSTTDQAAGFCLHNDTYGT